MGGLAESVAATLAFAGKGRRIAPIALPDEFLAAGALPTLHDRYGLSTDEVAARVKLELGATGHGHGPWPAEAMNRQPPDTNRGVRSAVSDHAVDKRGRSNEHARFARRIRIVD